MAYPIRMTDLAHGGGCGCKLSPAVLSEILAKTPAAASYANLLVGTETGDDAAVFRINERQAIVATTDFFTPVVDDPFDFGRIAATNALSDVYAMGGTPLFALAIAGMPIDKLPVEMIQQVIAGGASVCHGAGIPVAGGHSIDSAEPIYGLAAIGLVDPARFTRNSTARHGDEIILTKALGVGIYSAALKRQQLNQDLYSEMLSSMTQLNAVGSELPGIDGIHAVTDVTGFGLLGHALEMSRGATLTIEIEMDRLPLLSNAARLAHAGIGTGAAKRNWASYGSDVNLPAGMPEWQRGILCDPQTSGGLLIACAPEATSEVMALLDRRGFACASVVGSLMSGMPRVRVT